MSLTFPTGIQSRPSGLADLPNQFKRPVFEELYGFDAVSAVDNALLTESGNYILTESRAYLKFDLSAAIPPTASSYTNSSNSLTVTLTGSSAFIEYDQIPGAAHSYNITIQRLHPTIRKANLNISAGAASSANFQQTKDLITDLGFSSGDGLFSFYYAYSDINTRIYVSPPTTSFFVP
tara:strand:+ start:599 stop:1132 length:534 start_codon:yes stop_codon:yes gene_type:complete